MIGMIVTHRKEDTLIHVFIHSFIHLFTHSFIQSIIHFCMCSSLYRVFTHSQFISFIHSFIRSFIHSFIHPFIHSSTHLFIHSSIHSFIHSLSDDVQKEMEEHIRLVLSKEPVMAEMSAIQSADQIKISGILKNKPAAWNARIDFSAKVVFRV